MGQAESEPGGRLGLEGEVGEHVLHQGLVDQPGAEGAAMTAVMERLDYRLSHAGGRGHGAVEACQ